LPLYRKKAVTAFPKVVTAFFIVVTTIFKVVTTFPVMEAPLLCDGGSSGNSWSVNGGVTFIQTAK